MYAQQQSRHPTLTTDDYIEIEQLYANYVRATDMGGAGDGSDYAATFTSDGEFGDSNPMRGPDALKGLNQELPRATPARRLVQPPYVLEPTDHTHTGGCKGVGLCLDLQRDGRASVCRPLRGVRGLAGEDRLTGGGSRNGSSGTHERSSPRCRCPDRRWSGRLADGMVTRSPTRWTTIS